VDQAAPTLELLKMTWVAKFRYTRLKLDSVTVAKLWCGCEQHHKPTARNQQLPTLPAQPTPK
jgi:hypothetical protein